MRPKLKNLKDSNFKSYSLMVKKKNAEQDVGLVRMFNEMKKKHPDAMLLFRNGNFYEMYKEDALKASVILALKVSDKILPLEKDPIKLLIFPHHELDIHLPKLVRSGERVAICDAIDRPELMKKPKEKTGEDLKEMNTSNKNTMAKKKKEQAVQEEPTQTVKTAAEEKPAKEKKTETKAEVKSEQQAEQKAEAKQERKPREPQMITANGEKVSHGHAFQSTTNPAEQKAEAKQERKPREPQMITANGEKVSHGHAFQSTTNPADWYFTAKMDGVQLKPQKMDAADLAAYQKKEMKVPQLMEKYYPTKLMPKVSEEAFQMPKQLSGPDGAITIDKFNVYKEKDEPQLMEKYYPTKLMPKVSEEAFQMPKQLSGPDGAITIDKFNVYKEKDEQRPDYGKYKFYVQMGTSTAWSVLHNSWRRTSGNDCTCSQPTRSTSFPKEWTPKESVWPRTTQTTNGRCRWTWVTRARPASMNSPSMTATRSSRQRLPPGNRLQPSTSIRKSRACFRP